MPYKRRTTTNKRRYRRKPGHIRTRKNMRKRGTVMSKQLVIGDRTFCKIRYSNSTSSAPTVIPATVAAAYNYQIFYLNGMSPPFSGGGTGDVAPGFYDWAAFYQSYRVRACKVRVTYLNQDATNGYYVGIYGQNYNQPSNPASWAEFRQLTSNRTNVSTTLSPAGGNRSTTQLKLYVNCSRLLGNKVQYVGDDTYTGIAGGGGSSVNPVGLQYVWIYGLNPTGIGNIATAIPIDVSLTWYVEFFRRVTQFG